MLSVLARWNYNKLMLRLLHYSDVHLTARPLGFRLRDLASKRLLGYINVRYLGRGHRFKNAPRVVDAMMADARAGGFDHVIFSGDATKLAFDSEFEHAARRLGVNDPTVPPTLAVPGNHDYYTHRAAMSGRFEAHFCPWLTGETVDGHRYPFARRVGPAWLIGLCSSYPRPFFTCGAGGSVGRAQLERLKTLCGRLSPGPKILVTHYPLRRADGKVERRSHRLLDHRRVLAGVRDLGLSLWLHGHIHTPFVLPASAEIPFPIICAGSATQTGIWAHNEYEIDGAKLNGVRKVFDPATGGFRVAERFALDLPGTR